jgi:hypothetical protein
METHLNEDDVEIFDQSKLLDSSNTIEQLQKENEIDMKKKEKMFEQIFNESSALSDRVDQNPFLSVLRQAADKNTVKICFFLINRVANIQCYGSGDFLTPRSRSGLSFFRIPDLGSRVQPLEF